MFTARYGLGLYIRKIQANRGIQDATHTLTRTLHILPDTHLFILLFVWFLRATECVVVGAEIRPRLLDVQPLPAFESSVQCIVLIQ